MDEEEFDQVQDETLNEESNLSEEQSQESTEEAIDPKELKQRIDALTKGYTTTRQDLSAFRDEILSKLEELGEARKEEFGEDWQEEKPLTKKDVMEAIAEYEQSKAQENSYYEQLVDDQLAELRTQGIITSAKDEEDLLTFAAEHKITDLSQAAAIWQEVKEVRQAKKALKSKVKGEAGSKVGTSEKTHPGEQGVSYKEVHFKDWDELA